MTQWYFGMLFILLFGALYIGLSYVITAEKLSNFIIVWVMCGFYAGKYSMRYPKE